MVVKCVVDATDEERSQLKSANATHAKLVVLIAGELTTSVKVGV